MNVIVSPQTGLRWRHVLRHLPENVSLVSSDSSPGFYFSGSVDVSFSRVAFVMSAKAASTAESEGVSAAPIVGVSDGAVVAIDACSFHCQTVSDDDDLRQPDGREPLTVTSGSPWRSVGLSSTSDGNLCVSNSLLFRLYHGAAIDDAGSATFTATTFTDTSDAGLAASNNASITVEGCEFVNSQLLVHNNSQVEVVKSTFKRQSQTSPAFSAPPSPHIGGAAESAVGGYDLVKVRKGSNVNLVKSRFFAARPVILERVALDDSDAFIPSESRRSG